MNMGYAMTHVHDYIFVPDIMHDVAQYNIDVTINMMCKYILSIMSALSHTHTHTNTHTHAHTL